MIEKIFSIDMVDFWIGYGCGFMSLVGCLLIIKSFKVYN
jgi:hypothetical protein